MKSRQGRRDHVEEAPRSKTLLDSSKACSSTAATCRPYFVTDPERWKSLLENPVIRSTIRDQLDEGSPLPVLEQWRASAARCLSSAEDIEG